MMSRPSIEQLAGGDLLEPGDHPQQGGLAAARRADEHEELAVGDLEVHVANRDDAVRVHLRQAADADVGHLRLPPTWTLGQLHRRSITACALERAAPWVTT